ncbi:MAG TPA: dephospho-CoA kinase [Lachnospiraceae bacterium]|nr:dephospho-CoA kinase [Lachnospiraceae bacterium]
MRTIGITGGVGSGKTAVLAYIKEHYNCQVLLADELAHKVREPGGSCYEVLTELLGKEVLAPDGKFDRRKMAEKIFGQTELLKQVNGIIHPMVRKEILLEIDRQKKEEKIDFLFVEAALLIEGGYEKVLDELWYIYADEAKRRQRLKESRGYSDEKVSGIVNQQLSEEEFRLHCSIVIDNSGSLEDTYRQIDRKLEEYL